MKGEFRKGYEEAMTSVHEGVMDFWPELSEREVPVPSGKAQRAQAMVVEWLDGFDPPPQINFQQSEALQAIIADALPSPLEESDWRTMDSAPKNTSYENTIDLWIVNGNGQGWREVNCREAYSEDDKGSWIGPGGQWVTGGKCIDKYGKEYFSPRPVEPSHKRTTHWRPLPAPPTKGGDAT